MTQRMMNSEGYFFPAMKHTPFAFLFALMILVSFCNAQEKLPDFPPDRPGNTWFAEVLPHHKVSWENGFRFESSPDGSRTITLTSMIFRYGIFRNVELRVGTDFLLYNDGPGSKFNFGIAPLTIGTKIRLYESRNWLPSVGFLAEVQLPHVGSKDLVPPHLAPSMYLIFDHSITDWFSLAYNAGAVWNGEIAIPQAFLSLAFWFNITDNVGAFVETYNYLHPDGNQYMTDLGFTWMPSRRVQLDVSCDFDLLNFGKYYAVGCGVAWMIN